MEDPLLCFFPETEFTETKISRLYGQYGHHCLGRKFRFRKFPVSGTRSGLPSFIGSKMVLEIYNFRGPSQRVDLIPDFYIPTRYPFDDTCQPIRRVAGSQRAASIIIHRIGSPRGKGVTRSGRSAVQTQQLGRLSALKTCGFYIYTNSAVYADSAVATHFHRNR